MPTTKKQKRYACAVAHGKPRKSGMSKKVAKEMCSAPIKKKRKK